mmetsp:Transcript_95437/g.169443  ORF Transcript_95437/g.169443 Transcript_95437/m.169443 type:complete len:160 (-) Transcript_95437:162-641(-)|eukprot:CAMPEP_0197647328 /NCGR_PEP_ID=MMETSP1338-20131121/24932_1 /TAXON_ID=43686 ORGANISM="Pelagodinium beii, Strain RCC1491" /NCGR_SAMPLE_ID=MMETSP1338 /ASSEMBLY_ACC=CAM_ASM_000754 /LENGTH=159 /DNA_ID=CAMNT_0043221099 /DNA_START=48 /DNA_END=527 /DNA_ORIENTATION=-
MRCALLLLALAAADDAKSCSESETAAFDVSFLQVSLADSQALNSTQGEHGASAAAENLSSSESALAEMIILQAQENATFSRMKADAVAVAGDVWNFGVQQVRNGFNVTNCRRFIGACMIWVIAQLFFILYASSNPSRAEDIRKRLELLHMRNASPTRGQ